MFENFYVAVLNSIRGIGAETTKKLINYFGSAEDVLHAPLAQLQQAGVSQKIVDNLIAFRRENPAAAEKLFEFCHVKKIKICTFYDKDYPPILREISNAPAVFYYYGKLFPNAERIAVVGARDATAYGEKVSKMLGENLAAHGFTIVSGAARGIDTFAHSAALKTGRTVAVLGYGLNKIPSDNQLLLEEVVESGGVVMTEFPPNYEGGKRTFPARNRIIAGLSRGVIVVEAGEKSGALIAAKYAADNSRDVFAVPNDIFSEKSFGCHKLIHGGAILLDNVNEVFRRYVDDDE